jgi:hypothetical protein
MLYRRLTILLIACILVVIYACLPAKQVVEGPITFSSHIAPIIHQNCTKCHISDGPAPFSLLSYNEIAPKHKLIWEVISKNIMPPWPADPSYSNFANEMYLTDDEKAVFGKWIEQGLQYGDSLATDFDIDKIRKDLAIGQPDMVIPIPRVKILGNNTDLFLVMKIPFELPQDTFIRAIEFVPGNKRLVHHVNTHIITYDDDKKATIQKGKRYINQDEYGSTEIHKMLDILNDDGTYAPITPSVSNYLPGTLFSFYPPEIGGYRVKKKNVFYLNDLHYGPSAIEDYDSSYFKIYFSDKPPMREVKEFQMGTLGIAPVIPQLIVPADSIKKFTISATIAEDISLISIVPHMHLIGKCFLAYAVKPSGDTIPLIRIPDWDFRWQYFYMFKNLLKIPRGTTIYVEGVYDNTASNPNNPFYPPREIREQEGSMKTTDEMFQLIVTYVPYKQGDENLNLENAKP